MQIPPQPDGDFNITPKDKRLYDTWFDKLGPMNGLLSKMKVMNDFKNRGFELSDSTLDYIYDMSGRPKAGRDGLDRLGFSIFSHLTARAYFYGDDIPYPVIMSPLSPPSHIKTSHYSFLLNCHERICPNSS